MRCAVLGDPVAHSLSPTLHRAAYERLGLAWTYDAVAVRPGGLTAHVAGLGRQWRGLSVTAPLKREALALALAEGAGGVSDRARLAGVANTLVLTETGAHADNTDLPGAVAAVRERHPGAVERVVVLGGGATAASVGLAACELGAQEITLLARDPARAVDAVAAIGRHPQAPQVRVAPLAGTTPVPADLVVSTVPGAAQGPDVLARCAEVPVVFEVVYDPWPTPLAAAVLGDGRVLVSGLDLLVHQAALQLTAFTGLPAPLEVMRAAGAAALTARTGGPAPAEETDGR